MTSEMMAKLKRSLVKHEGWKKFPYLDTVGKITIGCGYNLSDRGIDDEWINKKYLEDITYYYNQFIINFPWFQQLTPDRQIILIDMAFMGWKNLLEFNNMFEALSQGDFNKAAFEMLNSKWAEQVKDRAENLAQGMLTGVYDV
jgi:lysozyme